MQNLYEISFPYFLVIYPPLFLLFLKHCQILVVPLSPLPPSFSAHRALFNLICAAAVNCSFHILYLYSFTQLLDDFKGQWAKSWFKTFPKWTVSPTLSTLFFARRVSFTRMPNVASQPFPHNKLNFSYWRTKVYQKLDTLLSKHTFN